MNNVFVKVWIVDNDRLHMLTAACSGVYIYFFLFAKYRFQGYVSISADLLKSYRCALSWPQISATGPFEARINRILHLRITDLYIVVLDYNFQHKEDNILKF